MNGYLKTISFQPGREVNKGDPLSGLTPNRSRPISPGRRPIWRSRRPIPRPREAESTLAPRQNWIPARRLTTARKQRTRTASARSRFATRSKGAYDEANASALGACEGEDQALEMGKIDESKAAIRTADLNLGYCTINATLSSGVVGDRLVTEGNPS